MFAKTANITVILLLHVRHVNRCEDDMRRPDYQRQQRCDLFTRGSGLDACSE